MSGTARAVGAWVFLEEGLGFMWAFRQMWGGAAMEVKGKVAGAVVEVGD